MNEDVDLVADTYNVFDLDELLVKYDSNTKKIREEVLAPSLKEEKVTLLEFKGGQSYNKKMLKDLIANLYRNLDKHWEIKRLRFRAYDCDISYCVLARYMTFLCERKMKK